jgi:hypothetical protein
MIPDRATLERDLAATPFREGVARGRWRLIEIAWPHVLFGVLARDRREFMLRLECSNYPAHPPTGGLWDTATGGPPAAAGWPHGDEAFSSVFRRDWQNGRALYMPLDRVSRTGHPDWGSQHPHLVWKPEIGIVQYLSEIHRHLNSRGYHAIG